MDSGSASGTTTTHAAAHTPGPWEWREGVLYPTGDSPNLHSIINDGGCSVHRVAQIEKWVPERDANHRLIAAAPDLLAALKAMLPMTQELIDDGGGCDHSVGICWCGAIQIAEDARRAIAKAEGTTA